MQLVTPPRISPQAFATALTAFAGAIGKDWVMASDADRAAYADVYAPGPQEQWPASAAVAPGSVEEVQSIVRLANEHKVPLWPVRSTVLADRAAIVAAVELVARPVEARRLVRADDVGRIPVRPVARTSRAAWSASSAGR